MEIPKRNCQCLGKINGIIKITHYFSWTLTTTKVVQNHPIFHGSSTHENSNEIKSKSLKQKFSISGPHLPVNFQISNYVGLIPLKGYVGNLEIQSRCNHPKCNPISNPWFIQLNSLKHFSIQFKSNFPRNESFIHCDSLNYEWLDSRKGYVGILRLDLGAVAKSNTHVLFLYDGIKGCSLEARDCN